MVGECVWLVSGDGCHMSNMSSSNVTAGSGTLLWIYRTKYSQPVRLSGRVEPHMIVQSIALHISSHHFSRTNSGAVVNQPSIQLFLWLLYIPHYPQS